MTDYFVFFDDVLGVPEATGLCKFANEKRALAFIQERLDDDSSRTVAMYEVIVGRQMELVGLQQVTKLVLKEVA